MTRVTGDSSKQIARWEIQLRKGVLEFVMLLSLREHERYGFELVSRIAKQTAIDVPEGTLYPLLLRLANNGLISSTLREGDGGAPRKYYALTNRGEKFLAAMTPAWVRLSSSVDCLLAGDKE